MHKVLKAFPCSFDGIHSERLSVGDERDFGSMAEGLKKAGLIGDIKPGLQSSGNAAGGVLLREDGPTVAEYVERGYLAANYPPEGYASRSTPEEIEVAIEAQTRLAEEAAAKENAETEAKAKWDALRADFTKLTVAQLREKAAEMKVQVADDAKKDDIIDALIAAAAAPQA